MVKKVKRPWPTKAVMSQIYEMNLWGGKAFDFYSGEGSHNANIINPYMENVIAFLEWHNSNLVVCDLGCGDFNIGRYLTKYSKRYIAIDIVENLINRNKKLYKGDNLEFHCLDIAKEAFPLGDCVILRQVLQHLSNAEIKKIIEKIMRFKYLILTEHIPLGEFVSNKDVISGQGIRLKQNSGVNLLDPPFSLKVKSQIQIGVYMPRNNKGRIVTTLFELDPF